MSFFPSECGCTCSLLSKYCQFCDNLKAPYGNLKPRCETCLSFACLETSTTQIWSTTSLISSNRARLIWRAVPFTPVFSVFSLSIFTMDFSCFPKLPLGKKDFISRLCICKTRQVSNLLKFKVPTKHKEKTQTNSLWYYIKFQNSLN